MNLPIPITYPPMEAKLVSALPDGPEWQYEPKFDGFRCVAFKDGGEVDLRSKSGQPFNRYFPEIVLALEKLSPRRFVLDGELVIPEEGGLSFDELLMRIHPAKSRVEKLSREHPALLVVFDMLVDDKGHSLVTRPLSERREALESFFARYLPPSSLLRLAPVTTQRREADEWLHSLGTGLDGIMAKRRDLAYQSGERTGMQKFKRMRSADCVVGGFRYGAKEPLVGSLLLGLFDDQGLLHHVGFTSNIKGDDKPALTKKLERLVEEPGFSGNRPGGPSRWSTERSGEWQPLAPKLVAEVQYDHFSGGRFRHGTKFLRWRPEKSPRQCMMDQVSQETGTTLDLVAAA
ncbi:MAG: ATP-dependent DNA ligase [Burkholderiales bacterium]